MKIIENFLEYNNIIIEQEEKTKETYEFVNKYLDVMAKYFQHIKKIIIYNETYNSIYL